ncbi:MAG: hypothetical protein RIQ81_2019 [Pseudomonadota bacterium]|jgi:hypothetical protein
MEPTFKVPGLIACAMIVTASATACKATGRRSDTSNILSAQVPASELKMPTVATLTEARKRALAAVANAGGKEPALVYINIYPTVGEGGASTCPKVPTVELGISYDPPSKDEPPKAAGFYLKPDPAANCQPKDELMMDASRALDAFIGMRPLDEVGTLASLVKVEPADFVKMNAATIKFEEMRAWNMFIKTILIPATMDSAQYQVDALCVDQSVASAYYAAIDGKRVTTGDDDRADAPLCGQKK